MNHRIASSTQIIDVVSPTKSIAQTRGHRHWSGFRIHVHVRYHGTNPVKCMFRLSGMTFILFLSTPYIDSVSTLKRPGRVWQRWPRFNCSKLSTRSRIPRFTAGLFLSNYSNRTPPLEPLGLSTRLLAWINYHPRPEVSIPVCLFSWCCINSIMPYLDLCCNWNNCRNNPLSKWMVKQCKRNWHKAIKG